MIKMEVIRILKLDGAGATKAFADVLVGDSFKIESFRIVEGEKGLFVGLPGEEGKNGKWHNTVIPLSREIKEELEKIVLEAYQA